MPSLDFKNSRNVVLDGFKYPATTNQLFRFSGSKTENVKLINTGIIEPGNQLTMGKEVPASAVQLIK